MLAELKEKHGAGETTIRDIVEELKKPNRDPRDSYPKPIMQKGVVAFEDLTEGMKITGKIKNVVDFGAFVDLGIKETALLHISEMSDHFVKDPLDAVKVGDVLEFRILSLDRDRQRIRLTRKSESPRPAKAAPREAGEKPAPGGTEKRKVTVTAKPDRPRTGEDRPAAGFGRSRADDDGTMYNPFAEALKKMREKKRD